MASREVSQETLKAKWDELFRDFPWLDGLTTDGTCGDVFCCPSGVLPDWGALSEAGGILWLVGGANGPTKTLRHADFPD